MTKNKTNFLLIKFPPGAAGKMLISLLGYHPEIQSWNNTNLSCHDWFYKCFQDNLESWMENEPQSPWPISRYVSAMYPRGDELTSLPIDFPQASYVPVVWHKLYPPNFVKDFKSVVILVDQQSTNWYHRSRWKKHFICEKQHNQFKIYKLQHRPSYQFGNFENNYVEYTKHLCSFIKKNVVNYDQKIIYSQKRNFLNDDVVINLSELLDEGKIINCLNKITKQIKLSNFDWSLVLPLWQHWRNLHNY